MEFYFDREITAHKGTDRERLLTVEAMAFYHKDKIGIIVDDIVILNINEYPEDINDPIRTLFFESLPMDTQEEIKILISEEIE